LALLRDNGVPDPDSERYMIYMSYTVEKATVLHVYM